MNGKKFLTYVLIAAFYLSHLFADQEREAKKDKYESLTGLKGFYNEKEDVFKISFPRNDIKISIDNTELDLFMGLTTWASFTPLDKNRYMVMGDLVLLQDEVNPVMSVLLNNNIEVTALHNHFFYENPKVYFMHIGGEGSLSDLSNQVKKAMSIVKEIRSKNSITSGFAGPAVLGKISIDQEALEKIFGIQGQSKEGMVKFVFGRSVKMHNMTIGSEMGVHSWAAFMGNHSDAIVDGDFAVLENELQPVLKALRKGNINVVAIHHHMILENPRMLFVHYWGKGNPEELAKTLKSALNTTKIGG